MGTQDFDYGNIFKFDISVDYAITVQCLDCVYKAANRKLYFGLIEVKESVLI